MPQRVIDRNDPNPIVGEISINPLPNSVREFGLVPDLAKLRAGDLILFQDLNSSRTGEIINSMQRRAGFSEEHSRWTHAAIYLEDDFILEAVPWPGVRTRSLYPDILERRLRVRRNLRLNQVDGYRIALRAQRMIGFRYSLGRPISLGFEIVRGVLGNSSKVRSSIICSNVFFNAHAGVTGLFLANCPPDHDVLPAHLSATTSLEDVAVGWLKLI